MILDRIVKQLGKGTFSKVVEAIDTKTNTRVAVKIVRAIAKYRIASQTEIRILRKLRELDPTNKKYASFFLVLECYLLIIFQVIVSIS